jgi:S1-C subfamily serine protease
MSARPFAGARYLAVAAEALPGASGGAVLDARGAVVGIVDLALLREPGVALAIPIERALERFARN